MPREKDVCVRLEEKVFVYACAAIYSFKFVNEQRGPLLRARVCVCIHMCVCVFACVRVREREFASVLESCVCMPALLYTAASS